MPTLPTRDRRRESGQILPLTAIALVVIVAMVALVIEAGNTFAQQRVAQNGADAVANAGAVVLSERLGGAPRTDADVEAATAGRAADNGLADLVAYYTDIQGNLLRPDGSVTTNVGEAAVVGPADGDSSIPPNSAGVRAGGTRSFGTTFGRVLGFDQFTAAADATAVTGILNGVCPADAGCGLLPVTFPVLVSTCDGQSDLVPGQNEWALVPVNGRTDANMATVPLCTTGPGSVGWLDLGDGNLASQIETPTHGSFDLPNWFQTQTGNVNAVEDEINDNHADTIVLIPMFDGTCRVQPGGSQLSDCPNGQEGVGNNTWYHIPKFTAFWLESAYVAGNNTQECNALPGSPFVGGNGATGCLKGWFVRYITQGPVVAGNPGPTDPTALGVRLIR